MIVKKYGNRRLYDTEASRYITLEELSQRIRDGADVTVLDARTGEDRTQATLAQIILESRGASKLLPVPLLKQLIRMGDDALAEFFSYYISLSLELYVEWKQGAQLFMPPALLSPLSLFSQWSPARFFARHPLFNGSAHSPPSSPKVAPPPHVAGAKEKDGGSSEDEGDAHALPMDELASLRREVEHLKRIVGRNRKRRFR